MWRLPSCCKRVSMTDPAPFVLIAITASATSSPTSENSTELRSAIRQDQERPIGGLRASILSDAVRAALATAPPAEAFEVQAAADPGPLYVASQQPEPQRPPRVEPNEPVERTSPARPLSLLPAAPLLALPPARPDPLLAAYYKEKNSNEQSS